MAIALDGDHLVAGSRRCPVQRIPTLVELHIAKVPRTQGLEATGLELRSTSFPSERLPAFIMEVCTWGGYAGIGGRVLNNNSLETIRSSLEALQAVNQLHSLGTPSFATKHLRFLFPRLCPVLDSPVSKNFQYPMSPAGYRRYSADCIRVAGALSELRLTNPMRRPNGQWFAADVDMTVFAMIAPWSI